MELVRQFKVEDNVLQNNVQVWMAVAFLLWIILVHFVVPMKNVPMGNSDIFPQGKPAATQSRHPTLSKFKVHAVYFRVSVIRQTLTWTT